MGHPGGAYGGFGPEQQTLEKIPPGRTIWGGSNSNKNSCYDKKDREGSLVATHEGLTTMAHSSRTGWTIMIKTQESLEEANVFSPTRHLLLDIKRLWQIDRVHGLPVVVVSAFFPSASKGDECWWGTQDLNTVYLWDTMDNKDRQDSLETLREKDNWVVWKTKDDKWTQEL